MPTHSLISKVRLCRLDWLGFDYVGSPYHVRVRFTEELFTISNMICMVAAW